MIDVIDHDNFGYGTQAGDAMRGAFDWEMYYKRIPIPPEMKRDDPTEPFECVSIISYRKSVNFICLVLFTVKSPQRTSIQPHLRPAKCEFGATF